MTLHTTLLCTLAASLLLYACPPGTTHHEDTDVGSACFPVDAQEDAALPVEIRDTCFSGSTQNLELSCSVEVNGDTISISSTAEYDLPNEITDDCQDQRATCTSAPLPAGNYTVTYGPNQASLEVPGPDAKDPDICILGR